MTTNPADSLPTYRPSGRISLRSVLVATFVGVPTALIVGWLYAWARGSTSSFVTVALCDLVFMVVNAIVVGSITPRTRSRSALFNTVFAVAWVGLMLLPWWLYSLRASAVNLPDVISVPQEMGRLLINVAGKGLEAFLLGVVPVVVARAMSREPFSEHVGKWAVKDFSGEVLWHDGDSAGMLSQLRHRGIAPLLRAPRSADTKQDVASLWHTAKVAGSWVEADPTARWVDIEIITNQRTEEGRVKSSASTLVSAWQLTVDDYMSLRQKFSSAVASPVPSHDPAPSLASENAADTPTPAELGPAIAALEAESYASALSMAQAHCAHPRAEVRADANRLCALASARLERWTDSFAYYHELFELEPSTFNALQLATTSVMAGELLRGQAWFDRADELNRESGEMPAPRMRTLYLSSLQQAGELAACRPHLEWLAGAYRAAKTTDSHLLWSYGLPFFSEFLEKSDEILREIMPASDMRNWYASMRQDLDEAGQIQLDEHLSRIA